MLAADVYRVLAAGLHRQLNAGTWRTHCRDAAAARNGQAVGTPTVNRPLAGLHDVDDFARTHCASPSVRDLVATLLAGCSRC